MRSTLASSHIAGKDTDTPFIDSWVTTMLIDKPTLKAYQSRWQEVARVVEAEQQQTSFEQRWRKLNSLLQMARALGLEWSAEEGQEDIVRQRWNLLKNRYLEQAKGSKCDSTKNP